MKGIFLSLLCSETLYETRLNKTQAIEKHKVPKDEARLYFLIYITLYTAISHIYDI